MTHATALYKTFNAFAEEGLLRRLGAAFAQFIGSLDDAPAPAPLLLGAALLSELEGRGHSCLNLADLVPDPCKLLAWPRERWQELSEVAGALPATVDQWRQVLQECPQVRLAEAADLQQPLVLDQDRLYLRRYWCNEALVADAVATRAAQARDVNAAAVRQWLDRLFEAVPGESGPDWQKIACAVAIRSNLSIITGGPGTGKTYTVARLLALLFALANDPAQLRIALAAPTGKAATRLKQSIDHALADLSTKVGAELPLAELTARMSVASTLHSLLGARPDTRQTRHHAGNPLDVDVLIVDEASMVHLEMMASLLDALPAKAMIILLGDKDQLASVEAGAVLGDMCDRAEEGHYTLDTASYVSQASGETIPASMVSDGGVLPQQTVMLRKSRRFGGPIGALASAVNAGNPAAAKAVLQAAQGQILSWIERARQDDLLDLAMNGREGATGGFGNYLALLNARAGGGESTAYEAWVHAVLTAFDEFRILCAVREGEWGVSGINEALENRLTAEGLLRCRGEWYIGRPVMVTRNDHGLGVFNGDVGITLPDPQRAGALRVYFLAGDRVRSVLASRLPHTETAYAMTVHKVQGSEFLHAAMVLPPKAVQVVTRELVYTGITRAKERFTLVSPDSAVLEEAVLKQTKRASGLQQMISSRDAV